MPCDLERIFGELSTRLPEAEESDDPLHLDETVIPPTPPELTTDRVRIYRSQLQRLPGCRGDGLDVVAPRSAIRQLGLLLLSVLFHEQCDRSILHLTHPDSALKHVVTEYKHWSKSEVSGFRFRPWVFGYVPAGIGPTFETHEVGYGAPVLRLTNLSDCQHDESEWRIRDVLHWVGGTGATAQVGSFSSMQVARPPLGRVLKFRRTEPTSLRKLPSGFRSSGTRCATSSMKLRNEPFKVLLTSSEISEITGSEAPTLLVHRLPLHERWLFANSLALGGRGALPSDNYQSALR